MRKLIAICSFVCWVSCNSSGEKNKADADSASGNSKENNDASGMKIVKLGAADLPSSIRFKGKLNGAWQWQDDKGQHILVTSVVAPYKDNIARVVEEGGLTAELHAFHFTLRDTGYVKRWQVSDSEPDCPFDITAAFINDAITITDLDNDGIAETWLQYKLACRSDVSPSDMKIIMYEDSVKYRLKGLMWVPTGEKDSFAITEKDMNLEKLTPGKDEYEILLQRFGRYTTDKDFAAAPPAFLAFARKQWLKFAKESLE